MTALDAEQISTYPLHVPPDCSTAREIAQERRAQIARTIDFDVLKNLENALNEANRARRAAETEAENLRRQLRTIEAEVKKWQAIAKARWSWIKRLRAEACR